MLRGRASLFGFGHLGDFGSLRSGFPLRRGLGAKLLGKALHPSFCVNQLLTASEEGMARGADFKVKLGLG
jgi:hypothetical protein